MQAELARVMTIEVGGGGGVVCPKSGETWSQQQVIGEKWMRAGMWHLLIAPKTRFQGCHLQGLGYGLEMRAPPRASAIVSM